MGYRAKIFKKKRNVLFILNILSFFDWIFKCSHSHKTYKWKIFWINNLPAFNIWLKIFSWIWIMMISWSANLSINLPIKSWLMQGFGWRNLLHEDFQWKTKKGIQVRWFAYKLPRNGNKKKLFRLILDINYIEIHT